MGVHYKCADNYLVRILELRTYRILIRANVNVIKISLKISCPIRILTSSDDIGFFWIDDVFVTGVARNAVSAKGINMYDWSKGRERLHSDNYDNFCVVQPRC